MGQAEPGSGWWLAADGNWYPPDLRTVRPLPSPARPARDASAVMTVLVVLIVVLTGAAIAIPVTSASSAGSAGAPMAARALVTSVQTTETAKTADVNFSMSMSGVGGTGDITASGSGQVDLADNDATATINYAGVPALQGTAVSEVIVGDTLYVSVPQNSQVLPGKNWVSQTLGTAGATMGLQGVPDTSDVSGILKMLASEGNTVADLGPSTIDGSSVQGYQVKVSPDFIKQQLANSSLQPAEQQIAQSLVGDLGLSLDVYVDSTTDMLRRIDMSMSTSLAGQSVAVQVREDLTNFGTPVIITAPPADQVATMQQLEQAASQGAPGGSGSGSADRGLTTSREDALS